MWVFYNPSPAGAKVGDCSVRAISKALGVDWETAYTMLCLEGFTLSDMPNSNAVINSLLMSKGFEREIIPNTCPNCYTIGDFANDHPNGTYVVGTGDHIVCITDGGKIWDTWDSSSEIPIYYYTKRGK